ncbi:thioredoxin-like 4, chloroplastic [Cynara cardunculus var. scolymus]|uniref:Thioredoxin n=1 Tax=Cynara cardunculus var. scolymus TaxID=59895 RepID=A0A124SGK0_CYNCS|nr:thioredoxin-like 4, chloroplastic [Cynara cardunculus var. scolymus]XP_024970099.1 thioredoxin-like 4, chloroplastic [Cynara cardunculus var. scolymus]KVI06646.1 Thioredoxin [Cynara cardunculus var. scolymus]
MSWSIHAAVQKQRILPHQTLFSFAKLQNMKTEFKNPSTFLSSPLDRSSMRSWHLKDKTPYDNRSTVSQYQPIQCMANGDLEELSDEDEELCPVECVREIKKDEELLAVLEKAKQAKTLVVVDFYRTSCGSCKYIEQGFAKLCKGSGNEDAAVIFLKHNVIDEYDEQSDIAERLRIKTVPLFHFYKDGILLEAFPTRDKERIKAAIEKYTAAAPATAQNA